MKLMVQVIGIFFLMMYSSSYGALSSPDLSFKFTDIFYKKCNSKSSIAWCKKEIREHIIRACDVRDWQQNSKDNFRHLIKLLKNVASSSFDWYFVTEMLQIISEELEQIAQRTDTYGEIARSKRIQLSSFKKELFKLSMCKIDPDKELVLHEPLKFDPMPIVIKEKDGDWISIEGDDWTAVDKEDDDDDKDCEK
jgi:hypothetical protein